MTHDPTYDAERGQPPLSAGTPAEAWQSGRHDWVLQSLHHLSRDVGRLSEAVDTLKDSTQAQDSKLDRIDGRLKWMTGVFAGVGGLLVILSGFTVWFLKDGVSLLAQLVAASGS